MFLFRGRERVLDSQAMTEIFPYLFQIEKRGTAAALFDFLLLGSKKQGALFFSADRGCLQVVHTFLQVV
jgi:hypothetical protein